MEGADDGWPGIGKESRQGSRSSLHCQLEGLMFKAPGQQHLASGRCIAMGEIAKLANHTVAHLCGGLGRKCQCKNGSRGNALEQCACDARGEQPGFTTARTGLYNDAATGIERALGIKPHRTVLPDDRLHQMH